MLKEGIEKSKYSFFKELAAVAVFCSVFAFLTISYLCTTAPTSDEITHLPSGYSYLLWNDYRMNPEHPPLVKKLAALPLLYLPSVWPSPHSFDQSQGQIGGVSQNLQAVERIWALGLVNLDYQWYFGESLLYGLRDEALARVGVADTTMVPPTVRLSKSDFINNPDQLFFWGRLSIVMLGILLAILIFLWSRDLFGFSGGLLALALFCFDPNFIAHSGLITTDVGVTLFMFGAVYFLWKTCQRVRVTSAALMMLFFAAAFATKYSSILLIPIFCLIGLGHILSTQKDWQVGTKIFLKTRGHKAFMFALLFSGCLAVMYGGLWAVYGFHYSAAEDFSKAVRDERQALAEMASAGLGKLDPSITERLTNGNFGTFPIAETVHRSAAIKSLLHRFPQIIPETEIQSAMTSAPVGLIGSLILYAQKHHLFPESYLYGFAEAERGSLLRSSFFHGSYSTRGFWYYFPMTFLLKTPLATLLAIGIGIFFAIHRRIAWNSRLAFLIVPVVVYAAIAVTSNLNIGHRHLLPIYPFLFVLCGGLAGIIADWISTKRKIAGALALGVIALNSSVVFAPPWKPVLVYPHYLAYFNELAGGPRNGNAWLVDSNLDWGQDLKNLSIWLEERSITEPINLCYFGNADPHYYQIRHVNMPGSSIYEQQEEFFRNPDNSLSITNLQRPGYLAISATALRGIGTDNESLWAEFLGKNAKLIDTVGYSIFIYRID